MRCSIRKNEVGVSFIEFMILVLLLGIVSAIALPSFGNLIIQSRISTSTTTLQSALLLARAEAIKRGKNVVICRSMSSNQINPTCATNGGNSASNSGWGDGWLIYEDQDSDKKFTSKDRLIRIQNALFSKPSDGAIFPSPNRSYLSFNPTGQTFGSYIRFRIYQPSNDSYIGNDRFLCVASGGRARVDNESCTNN